MASKFPIWGEGQIGNVPTEKLERPTPVYEHLNYDTGTGELNQGMQQAAQGSEKLAAFMDHQQEEADKAAALELKNDYELRANNMLAQFKTLQGKNAIAAQPELSSQLIQLRSDYAAKTPNKRSEEFFVARSADPLVTTDRSLKLHASDEYTKWMASNFTTGLQLKVEGITNLVLDPNVKSKADLVVANLDEVRDLATEFALWKGYSAEGIKATQEDYLSTTLALALNAAVKQERPDSARALLNLIDKFPEGNVTANFYNKHPEIAQTAHILVATAEAQTKAGMLLAGTQRAFAPKGTPDPQAAINAAYFDYNHQLKLAQEGKAPMPDPLAFNRLISSLHTQQGILNTTWTQQQVAAADDLSRAYGEQFHKYGRTGMQAWEMVPVATRQKALQYNPAAFVNWIRGIHDDETKGPESPEQERRYRILSDRFSDPGYLASVPQSEFDAALQSLHPRRRDEFTKERFRIQMVMKDPGRKAEATQAILREEAYYFDSGFGKPQTEWDDNQKGQYDLVNQYVRRRVAETTQEKKRNLSDDEVRAIVRGGWAKYSVHKAPSGLGWANPMAYWRWAAGVDVPFAAPYMTGAVPRSASPEMPADFLANYTNWAKTDTAGVATFQHAEEGARAEAIAQAAQTAWLNYYSKGEIPPFSYRSDASIKAEQDRAAAEKLSLNEYILQKERELPPLQKTAVPTQGAGGTPKSIGIKGHPNTDEPPLGDRPIDENRPVIYNPDNTFSTERTITVEIRGRQYLIPTIVDGVQRTPEEAINLFKQGKNPEVGVYRTIDEAEAAAKRRTEEIGKRRGSKVLGNRPPATTAPAPSKTGEW